MQPETTKLMMVILESDVLTSDQKVATMKGYLRLLNGGDLDECRPLCDATLDGGSCELYRGHKGRHSCGYYMWD